MATDKDIVLVRGEGAATHRVQFWASTVDAFLQDFLAKAKANDRLGLIVAASRLAQLGAAMAQEYMASVNEFCESSTELKVAQQQCSMVVKMVNDNGERVIAMRTGDSALEAATKLDPSQN